ncbi:hypothetical protein [Legionella gresilensis]|uniref:hypothetical protein n=1 Tax=Legionella gresilensis TaxID=91823 RepID=UPI0010413165|nr:hypothetical protein [Legionella gresilensis]
MKKGIFKPIPLAEMPAVTSHLKFNSILDREGAENFLDTASSDEYIIRKSSLGSDCLALTLVTKFTGIAEPHKVTSQGLNLHHFLIDSNNPTDDRFTKAQDPVEEIRRYMDFIEKNREFVTPQKYTSLMKLKFSLTSAVVSTNEDLPSPPSFQR